MPQARDIMVTDWLLVDKGQEVGKVVEKAREKRFQVIPIVSEKKLIGVVTYRDLLIRRIPPRTRVDKVMEPPFYINQREDIISIISKFLKWRVKAIPVVDDSMKYLGMISRNVLINGFKAQLKGKVKEYMSSPAIYIEEEESVARGQMGND
jgi:Mg/Co/Ni transporter MgtE (contains CBS domain)